MAAVLRFLFNLPSWFQIGGFVVGVIVAAVVLVVLWRRRTDVVFWFITRARQVRIAIISVAAVVLLVFVVVGLYGYHYMEHDNGFCTGCHVMKGPYLRFAGSKHDSLECHQCHQQGMYANLRQLYLWVANKPTSIGKHAKVPTRVCANCHVRGDAKETWQRIASTAGHRTHLQSDSAALKNVQCVTCHGYEVHRFVPVDSTCEQAGCHTVQIKLANMRNQTDLHCVLCHRFTAEVPALATYDSAKGTLVPGKNQCFGCHQMQAMLAEFDPARDPHRGQCGDCHNPHTQTVPAEAAQTCASAKCHADWRSQPFHTGANHRNVVQNCILCHEPHHAKVDPSDCAGCHAAVRAKQSGKHLNPPLPFDTTKALERVSVRFHASPDPPTGGHGPFFVEPPLGPGREPDHPDGGLLVAADSFSHTTHRTLHCITCHKQGSNQILTFQRPRGCQICHHQAAQSSNCAACHSASELTQPESVTVRVTVAPAPPHFSPARFDHGHHTSLKCVTCHTTPATLEPDSNTVHCDACHDQHHGAETPCSVCHTDTGAPAVRAAHAPPVDAHVGCDNCHTASIVARLVPNRELCVTCHREQRNHQAGRECTVCHFGMTPEAFQAQLRKAES
ncbi:MAG TPA: hypothetical protein VLV45_01905 [Gemmatimonadales bacterium]|nr:hypothetical protein [Gemmatimonadales bacterium]